MSSKHVDIDNKRAKYDWVSLKYEYLSSNLDLVEFSEKKGIPYQTLSKWSSKEKWNEQREDLRKQTEKIMLNKIVIDRAFEIGQQNERDIKAVKRIYKLLELKLDNSELNLRDLKTISSSLKDLQAVARLALDASTDNTANVTLTSFEDWLDAR